MNARVRGTTKGAGSSAPALRARRPEEDTKMAVVYERARLRLKQQLCAVHVASRREGSAGEASLEGVQS